jgi:hypothetical protein
MILKHMVVAIGRVLHSSDCVVSSTRTCMAQESKVTMGTTGIVTASSSCSVGVIHSLKKVRLLFFLFELISNLFTYGTGTFSTGIYSLSRVCRL